VCAGSADRPADCLSLVGAEIVENDDVAEPQRRDEELLDTSKEALAVDQSVQHPGRFDAVGAACRSAPSGGSCWSWLGLLDEGQPYGTVGAQRVSFGVMAWRRKKRLNIEVSALTLGEKMATERFQDDVRLLARAASRNALERSPPRGPRNVRDTYGVVGRLARQSGARWAFI
jgi:hypothetical protein